MIDHSSCDLETDDISIEEPVITINEISDNSTASDYDEVILNVTPAHLSTMVTHLSLIHKSLSKEFDLYPRMDRQWEFDLSERVTEFTAQIVFMFQNGSPDVLLPYSDYEGGRYGTDILLGKQVLSNDQLILFRTIEEAILNAGEWEFDEAQI